MMEDLGGRRETEVIPFQPELRYWGHGYLKNVTQFESPVMNAKDKKIMGV